MKSRGFYHDFLEEMANGAEIHKPIAAEIEGITNRAFIAYVANAAHPAQSLSAFDIEQVEGMLMGLGLARDKDGLDLLIESPGGTPDAAERLVRVCRTYSKDFRTLIMGQAMSAATLVCLGSDEAVMGETASLGSIDPQMVYQTKEGTVLRPAKSIVDAFKEAVGAAQHAAAAKQPTDAWLHILGKFDLTFVVECLRARESTKRIAADLLASGLMKGKSTTDVAAVVDNLVKRGDETYHGRPLWSQEAAGFGMNVTTLTPQDPLWIKSWQLLTRMKRYAMDKQIAKYFVTRIGGIEQRVTLMPLR